MDEEFKKQLGILTEKIIQLETKLESKNEQLELLKNLTRCQGHGALMIHPVKLEFSEPSLISKSPADCVDWLCTNVFHLEKSTIPSIIYSNTTGFFYTAVTKWAKIKDVIETIYKRIYENTPKEARIDRVVCYRWIALGVKLRKCTTSKTAIQSCQKDGIDWTNDIVKRLTDRLNIVVDLKKQTCIVLDD